MMHFDKLSVKVMSYELKVMGCRQLEWRIIVRAPCHGSASIL